MGRAPCCDKANVKKGPWSPEEDAKLKSYIEQHGTGGNWIALPQKIGLKRCGKSCRLRWLNYLRPNIKHGGFSEEEDNIICSLYISIGSRWSIIAAQLPGRTDNDIKNYWNTRLKKKLLGKQRKEQHSRKGSHGLIKQEMKRLNGNQMLSPNINNNQNPYYWPELPFLSPVPFSSQEPRFNDHASIRKLLIKLGGRFSNDDHQLIRVDPTNNPQFQNETSYTHNQQLNYDNPLINVSSSSSSSSMDAINDAFQFAQQAVEYNIDGAAGFQMLQQEQGNLPLGVEEMSAFNNPQRLDGLEFLLADEMLNNRSSVTGTCGETTMNMGEMLSSLVYPPMASNCAFEELRYPGSL
ncbi:hypothetical protein JCGZ_15975 [Jatropha curcas]|uniref:MYB family protein n=1 Tax=Jatropha curcas TaxID=180498 RepID=A0A067L2V2_JATCU|nr:transcription factor RAX3 [Jatropha curcas]AIT52293.1 MYB family protein [Jatropha curcas]KDP41568.1 hypothetical protein JCGZ_15975 [Jatropha curcas]